MKTIFTILCGLLYCIGIPFGWSYETTSVYICIYLWPIICTLSTVPIIWQSIKLVSRKKMLGLFLVLLAIIYTAYYGYYTLEAIHHYNINDPHAFMNCMLDLKSLASYFKISYEAVNILIYVVGFTVIVTFNYVVARIIRKL